MSSCRQVIMVALLSAISASPALAGKAADAWKADTQPANSSAGEIPSYCKSLAGLINKRVARLRGIRLAIENQRTKPATSVLDFTQQLMGNSYQSDWEKGQLAELAKGKAEAVELNERYKDQKCGSIDIEQGIARAPDPQVAQPLRSKEKRKKF